MMRRKRVCALVELRGVGLEREIGGDPHAAEAAEEVVDVARDVLGFAGGEVLQEAFVDDEEALAGLEIVGGGEELVEVECAGGGEAVVVARVEAVPARDAGEERAFLGEDFVEVGLDEVAARVGGDLEAARAEAGGELEDLADAGALDHGADAFVAGFEERRVEGEVLGAQGVVAQELVEGGAGADEVGDVGGVGDVAELAHVGRKLRGDADLGEVVGHGCWRVVRTAPSTKLPYGALVEGRFGG